MKPGLEPVDYLNFCHLFRDRDGLWVLGVPQQRRKDRRLFSPFLKNFAQGFKYIQEYTGFIPPSILAIFLLGFFWRKATASGALAATLLSIPLSAWFKYQLPEMPFLNRMGYVFWLCLLAQVVIKHGRIAQPGKRPGLPAGEQLVPGLAHLDCRPGCYYVPGADDLHAFLVVIVIE